MTWFKYPSIKRLGDVEVSGILDMPEVWVEPKIDGANAAVFVKDGILSCAKRNSEITEGDKGFRGMEDYVAKYYDEFIRFFDTHPNTILFGEWLVKHTIGYYDKEAYGHFYVFDIFCPEQGHFVRPDRRLEMLGGFDIKFVPILSHFTQPPDEGTLHDLLVQNTFLITEEGKFGEGLVIKGYDGHKPYINKFGRPCWSKVVRPSFQEKCPNEFPRPEPGAYEKQFAETYVVQARVDKIKEKICTDKGTGWSSKYIGEVIGRMWNDIFTEELWNFVKDNKVGTFNFKKAQKQCMIETKKYLGL